MFRTTLIMTVLCIAYSSTGAHADYVLVLKNGRQITVQNYRVDGAMLKFSGLGGEIAIAKDQILAIEKSRQSGQTGLSLPELERSSRQTGPTLEKPTTTPPRQVSATPSPGEKPPTAEEFEYRKKLAEVTAKLEAAKEKYLNATQGGGSSNVGKQGWQGVTADIGSRIRDSQKVPGGGGSAGTPPMQGYEAPVYTPKEKELSDLRIEIDNLQKERDSLLQEMKSKNIPTGAF